MHMRPGQSSLLRAGRPQHTPRYAGHVHPCRSTLNPINYYIVTVTVTVTLSLSLSLSCVIVIVFHVFLSVNSSSVSVGCSSSCCGCCCCCCCCCFSCCSVCRNSPISSRSYCDSSSSPRLFCSSCRCRRSLFFSSLSCCMCLSCPVYFVRMLKPPIVRCFGIGFFSMMEYTLIPVLINFPQMFFLDLYLALMSPNLCIFSSTDVSGISRGIPHSDTVVTLGWSGMKSICLSCVSSPRCCK